MTVVDIVEVGFHHRATGAAGLAVGECRAHPGPGTVGADGQVEVLGGVVVVVQACGAVGERGHGPYGMAPTVFDLDADVESAVVAAVRDRAPGQSVLHALRDHMVHTRTAVRTDDPTFVLVESTPALRDYARRMWMRHEETLAATLAEAAGLAPDASAVTGLARFALEAPSIARASEDLSRTMRDLFALLEGGWATMPLA
ncbi:hypothetical protein Srufu_000220 [Streptomyces libani subsp. rufus]|nr:hypothetical protein Srufu_000220 [Streptomyces libani subsp. rufus]